MTSRIGFDGTRYIQLQKEAILERMRHFSQRLYLEVGGKFLYDGHASRVLPGFIPNSKEQIFRELFDTMEIIFCVNYDDIVHDRQLGNDGISYTTSVMQMISDIHHHVGKIPYIAINKCPREQIDASLESFELLAHTAGRSTYRRYIIPEYPHNTDSVLSEDGYGYDEYIPTASKLVLVTGAASNSGKMSTCLGQIYHEHMTGHDSGYAKYETFPIRNLPLNHPINLAYEAATADIGDYNMIDTYHSAAYGIDAVNYNRDVDAFDIVMTLAHAFLPEANYTRHYQSPTDMGISKAGFCIIDDTVCSDASKQEIIRRGKGYQDMVNAGKGEAQRVEKCAALEKKCA